MKPERSLSHLVAMMAVLVMIARRRWEVVCSDPSKLPTDPVHIHRKRERTWSILSPTWCLCTFRSARIARIFDVVSSP
jgi:hypothetical protein